MAFASALDRFRDRSQHAASVLALSFAGIEIREAPRDGEYKGIYLGVPKQRYEFLAKPIELYFDVGRVMSKVNETTVNFGFGPIEWIHAQWAPKVWKRLPQLLPPFHEWLEKRLSESRGENWAAELEQPAVCFSANGREPTNEWSFQVFEPSYQFGHYANFRGFELVDCSTVG